MHITEDQLSQLHEYGKLINQAVTNLKRFASLEATRLNHQHMLNHAQAIADIADKLVAFEVAPDSEPEPPVVEAPPLADEVAPHKKKKGQGVATTTTP